MKGHVYQRSKSGSWTIVYDLPPDPATGKRRQRSQALKGTKRDAERILREIQISIDKGTYVKPNKVTVGDWLKQWLHDYVAINTSPRTLESYRSNVESHLIPMLGKMMLSDLQPQHIQSYYATELNEGRRDGRGGLSARSVVYHHRILRKALDYAVKMGLVVRNVSDLVEPPRIGRVTMQTLSPEEVGHFLDVAKDTGYYVFFATLIYTGLRRGELLALRWRNLDLNIGTLAVMETAYKLGNGEWVIKEPKTPNSRRMVTLSSSLVELFKAYRADQELLRVQLGVTLNADDFVFISPDGTPVTPNAVTLAFRRIIKKAGLKDIRLHDLRHTHATLMLKAGVHPKVVSERLGHANIGITLDIYSHVMPGMQEAAAEKFDRIFEVDDNENSGANVSKMLANSEGLASEPSGARTLHHLIKSQEVSSQIRKEVMMQLGEERCLPKTIGVDNGPEFISKRLDQWAYLNNVTLDFSRPGKPTDNGIIEAFNGRLR